MARSLRPLLLAVLLALAVVSNALAASPYDPDSSGFSTTPSTDLSVGSGTCTFDTNTGAVSGAGCPSARAAGGDGTVVDGIGVFVIPSGSIFESGTMEFVMRSVSTVSGSAITYVGANNLVVATLHDLTVTSGATVNANGLGGAGGTPGTAGDGFGAGEHSVLQKCPDAGGGGSFGGLGGDGGNGVPSGGTYGGDQKQHLDAGSGGGGAGTGSGCGTVAGGNGGGGVGLIAMGTLTVDGTVSANGTPTSPTSDLPDQGGPGGGSGGAILLMAPHLAWTGQSVASAKGGYGYSTSLANASGGGGGGGGTVEWVSDQPTTVTNPLSVGSGLGGTTADPGVVGLPGAEGNGGAIGGLPFITVSGPTSRQAGTAASFSSSLAAGGATFAWDFGDGGAGTGQAASHTYAAAGTYNVRVTATLSDSGQTATAHRSITVTRPPSTGGGGGGGNPQPQPQPQPPQPAPPPQCAVPKLKGLSLRAARRKLSRAHCKLGKVKKPKLRKSATKKPTLVVARQSPGAGKKLANGSKVNVTLAVKKPKRHKHS